jgi:hypothetical protein
MMLRVVLEECGGVEVLGIGNATRRTGIDVCVGLIRGSSKEEGAMWDWKWGKELAILHQSILPCTSAL